MTSVDLKCTDLVKQFGETLAVDKVSFSVPQGSFFSILGPSGCGKTTIMRMIAGFLQPTSGDILIRDKSVLNTPPNKRPVNMVFQHLALFPMMTIEENIGYGLRRRGESKAVITRKVGEVLERVGLPGVQKRKANELSGGQKQRIAIARCMVLEPDVLLLDEPLGALDLKLREQMKVELKALQNEFQSTFLYITHDQGEALVMSDHVGVMRAGRFEQVGTAQELYYQPQTAFVAGFVGDSNRWTGKVVREIDGLVEISTAQGLLIRGTKKTAGLAAHDEAQVLLRPEAIVLGREAASVASFQTKLSGKVEQMLFNGAQSRVIVRPDAGGDTIEVTLPQSGEFQDLAMGSVVHLGWSDEKAHVFAGEAL